MHKPEGHAAATYLDVIRLYRLLNARDYMRARGDGEQESLSRKPLVYQGRRQQRRWMDIASEVERTQKPKDSASLRGECSVVSDAERSSGRGEKQDPDVATSGALVTLRPQFQEGRGAVLGQKLD